MWPKLLAFIMTTIACLIAAVVLFFGMIMAMNGYSESDASWGIGVFAVLSVLTTLCASGGAILITNLLVAKQFHPIGSIVLAVTAFSIVGSVLIGVSSVIGILCAELVRTSF